MIHVEDAPLPTLHDMLERCVAAPDEEISLAWGVCKLMQTGCWEIVPGINSGEVWIQNYNSESLPVGKTKWKDENKLFRGNCSLLIKPVFQALVWHFCKDHIHTMYD